MKKRPKNSKNGRKIALLSLYLLCLYHIWKSRGATAPLAPRCRRPWARLGYLQPIAIFCKVVRPEIWIPDFPHLKYAPRFYVRLYFFPTSLKFLIKITVSTMHWVNTGVQIQGLPNFTQRYKWFGIKGVGRKISRRGANEK